MEILDENNIQLFGQSIQSATEKLNKLTQIVCENLKQYFEHHVDVNLNEINYKSLEENWKQLEKLFDQQHENVSRCETITKTLEKIKKHISIVKEGLKPLEQFIEQELPPVMKKNNDIIDKIIPVVETIMKNKQMDNHEIDNYIDENYDKYRCVIPGQKVNKEEKALERHAKVSETISFDEISDGMSQIITR